MMLFSLVTKLCCLFDCGINDLVVFDIGQVIEILGLSPDKGPPPNLRIEIETNVKLYV